MALLRLRNALFDAGGESVGPISLELEAGERIARTFATAGEARVAAMLACGIVKATGGSVSIEEFDPRVQSKHCKRIAAFVPHEPLPLTESEFERHVLYRAALWGVDPRAAVAHARLVLERTHGMHEAFAYPLAGALVPAPKLLVLDRPEPRYAEQILAAAGLVAVFSTHVSEPAAAAFV